MISRDQIRAARALLDWGQPKLADLTGVSTDLISKIENGITAGSVKTLTNIQDIFEYNGIEFSQNDTVSRPPVKYLILKGDNWFEDLLNDTLYVLEGGMDKELLIFGGNNSVTPTSVVEKFRELRRQGVRMREMVCEGDTYLMGPEKEYKWIKKEFFNNRVTVIYENRVCYDLGKKAILVINEEWARTERNKFEMLWDSSLNVSESTAEVRYE